MVCSGAKAGGGDLGSGDHGLVPLTAGSFNWFFSHRHQQPLISAKTMAVLQSGVSEAQGPSGSLLFVSTVTQVGIEKRF